MDYKILNNKGERKFLKEAAYKITNFIKDKQIPTIIAIDKSGRPAGLLISYAYKHLYPNEKQPKISFLNPDNLEDGMTIKEKNDSLDNYISKNSEKPILILDEYLTSGNTIKKTKEALIKNGAKKVYTSVLGGDARKRIVDISGMSNLPRWYGFPKTSGVKEEKGKSYPNPTKEALELRKELKQLANEIKEEHSKSKLENILGKIFGSIFSAIGIYYLIRLTTINFTGNIISNNLTNFNLGFFASVILFALGIFLLIHSIKKKN